MYRTMFGACVLAVSSASVGCAVWQRAPRSTNHVILVGHGPPASGILVMAHGGDAAWNEDVEKTIAPLRERFTLEIAYGMASTTTLREAVQRLEARGAKQIAVVRMFISGESFLEQTEYILGLRSEVPPPIVAPGPLPGDSAHGAAHVAQGDGHSDHCMDKPEPIGSKSAFVLSAEGVADSSLVDEILVDRAQALSKDPSRESILLLGHGPGDDGENQRWLAKMNRRAKRISDLGTFRAVQCETLREDWPDKRVAAEQRIRRFMEEHGREGGRVIVIPFRVAGFGPYREVLEGLSYISDGRGFCPHPNMTEWIERTANDCFRRLGSPARANSH